MAAIIDDPVVSKRDRTASRLHDGTKIERAITVLRPVAEVFAFWRNFQNLPKFMQKLESIEVITGTRAKWHWKIMGDRTLGWETEIIAEIENRMISWQSVGDSDVDNAGSIWFRPAPQDGATEIHIQVMVRTPGGKFIEKLASLFGEDPGSVFASDLLRFKSLMEAGEIPTTEGQPHGSRGILH